MDMNFFTWDYLLTFAGCVASTGLLTQLLKPLTKKVPTQVVSYLVALTILVVGQLALGKVESWDIIVLDAVNAIAVALASNGSYDAVDRAVHGKTDAGTELKDEGDSEVMYVDEVE